VLKQGGVELVVCEHTGKYESMLVAALHSEKLLVHCAHSKATHHFAKARKISGKSDPIDAETILQYGLCMELKPDEPPRPELLALKELAARRNDLNEMLVMEKNRLQAPGISPSMKREIKSFIRGLEAHIARNEKAMAKLIKETESLQKPIKILTKEYGVGLISAAMIYAAMPELGTLTRQTAGSLAGLAPIIRESGKYQGQRRIGGGRAMARNALYMVAMTAIRKRGSILQSFYATLKKTGKCRMVALTAVMRKLIVRFNTLLKELYREPQVQLA
jgi:transposase